MNENVVKWILNVGNTFFLVYLVVYVGYLFVSNLYGSVKIYQCRKLERLHNQLEHDFYFPISIIVSAYNENITLLQTIENLTKLDYKIYEIVVVDDGSTDNTKQLVIDTYHLEYDADKPIRYQIPCRPIREVYHGKAGNIPLILISKENGKCKADATNAGINVSSYPYVVSMDADEVLQKDALQYVGKAFIKNDNVIAVAGNIKASNDTVFENALPVFTKLGRNRVVNMQVLEYGRAFVGSRIFRNVTNSNLIISGGFGAFQKSAVIEVGGYDTKSMGEDMEITMKLHSHFKKKKEPYYIEYVPDSVCWTQVPNSMADLKKQRERWHCGLMQNIWKYRNMILNPRYGAIGLFTIPFFIFYELLCPIFILLGWLSIVLSCWLKVINIQFAILVFGAYILLGTVMTVTAYLDKMYMKNDGYSFKDILLAIEGSLLDAVFFRPFLFVIEFFGYFKYKKIQGRWVSPKRVAMQVK